MTTSPVTRTPRRSIGTVGLGALGLSAAVLSSLAGCAAESTISAGPSSARSTTSSSASPEPATAAAARAVVALVAERLDTAPEVAAAKYHSGQPVEDAARERTVLDTARTAAERDHVDPDWVEAVFADQIEASKQAQTALLDEWSRYPDRAPAEAPDLTTTVRPTLDRITSELVSGLARLQDVRDDPSCTRDLRRAARAVHVSDAPVQQALPTAIEHLCTVGPGH
ncbi:gamma subclass chorismate mutase AroQ [Curtobacterium sp. RHCJP20]|uniref:chorismate mutase n=1 Tax=Curtobacterium subtropicum TaxID=3055138 RepID=A0ABT7TEP7_9MICO|nr:gamma subclass chorismate mutase AroQ [Curtobacterium subtropicum]MDM7888048.1 gamma subclass chorismate mutase AroQ [Curtobacterium subtropicum]